MHCQRWLLSCVSLLISAEASLGAALLGFKPCEPGSDPACNPVGEFGNLCNETLPCARGLYCKKRSKDNYFCDNGVEETHQCLKRLVAGCLDTGARRGLELTAIETRDVLNSYQLTDSEKNYLEDETHFIGDKCSVKKTFCPIQSMAMEACDQGCVTADRLETLNDDVIDKLIAEQTNLPAHDDFMDLYRIDNRSPVELRKDGGFFGPNPVTLRHARLLAPLIASYTTSSREANHFVDTPFTAATEEIRTPWKNSLLQYKIRVPIPVERRGDPSDPNLQLIYNGKTLDDSQIVGLRSGKNIAFLTGLPAAFVKSVDFNDGRSFIPISKAIKMNNIANKIKASSSDIQIKDSFSERITPLKDSGEDDDTDKRANVKAEKKHH